jgi:hypothetical protein
VVSVLMVAVAVQRGCLAAMHVQGILKRDGRVFERDTREYTFQRNNGMTIIYFPSQSQYRTALTGNEINWIKLSLYFYKLLYFLIIFAGLFLFLYRLF